jgi:oligopeptide transport system substrate-binding protein
MAFPTFYPVHQASVEAADPDGTVPGKWAQEAGFVCNGAYTLESWNHNESMVYVKNPNFYDAANVTMDELHFMLSADDTATYAAYNSGDLDYIDSVPNDEIPSLNGVNPEFGILDNLGTYYIGFNVNDPIFDGKTEEEAAKMREAISLLVDRQFIVENVGQTGQIPADSFVPVWQTVTAACSRQQILLTMMQQLPVLASLRQQRAYWKRLDTHLQTTVTVHTQ